MRTLLICCLSFALLCATAMAQPGRRRPGILPAPSSGGVVTLPWTANDPAGNQWMVYPGGWMRQNGNTQIYQQAAQIIINGAHPNFMTNNGRIDPSTGELLIDDVQVPGLGLERRIWVHPEESWVRYVDVFRNPGALPLTVQVQLMTSLNYGLPTADVITDPRQQEVPLGWAAATPVGRTALEIFAGPGAQVAPQVQFQPGSNIVTAVYTLNIPPGKEAAIVHFHLTCGSQEEARKIVQSVKPREWLKSLPAALVRRIVNFRLATSLVGDRELYRHDSFDTIELSSGDRINGTIVADALTLKGDWGDVRLPAERMVGMLNVGQFRPRQLIVTVGGEVFGGSLTQDSVQIELSSGQRTQVPLGQIASVGFRKRPGEAEELAPATPAVVLRGGDRAVFQVPTEPLSVATRFGTVSLPATQVAVVDLAPAESGVHAVTLTDGSRFSGLLGGDVVRLRLPSVNQGEPVEIPLSEIRELRLATDPDEPGSGAAIIELGESDRLVGSLLGDIQLDTVFDTLTIDCREVRELANLPDGSDVQVTLWDQTKVSGRLRGGTLRAALVCGATLSLPVSMVTRYDQPLPLPSKAVVTRIMELVQQLSAPDWKTRDAAQASIVAMGLPVARVLHDLRATASPEAQTRIDAILRELNPPAPPATPPPASGQE
jgi:hypothetical protein